MKSIGPYQSTPIVSRGYARQMWLAFALAALGCSAAPAQDQSGQLRGDCTDFDIAFEDTDEPLTDAEISALRDRELLGTLSQLDRCIASGSGQDGGGGGGGGNGAGAGSGSGNGSGSSESFAGSGIQGTEAPAVSAATSAHASSAGQQLDTTETASPATDRLPESLGGGKVPEDIPPVDNNDILAAQLFEAARSEPDPEKAEKLWNEYRKFKGLPQQ